MCHVLIIEDDAIAAIDIRDTLRSAGATSFSFAETEKEAVICAREMQPALITSDVMLARGSGPRAVRLIHEEFGVCPVIFITATPDQCDPCEGHHVLEKPFRTDHLKEVFCRIAPLG
jgi:CheY-like chemotaxis protein